MADFKDDNDNDIPLTQADAQDLQGEIAKALEQELDLKPGTALASRALQTQNLDELARRVIRGDTDSDIDADSLQEQVEIEGAIRHMASLQANRYTDTTPAGEKESGLLSPSPLPVMDTVREQKNKEWENIPGDYFSKKRP